MSLSKLKISINISRSRLIIVVATIFFLLVNGSFYKSIALSFPFVDEQYNFAIGKYLVNGEILYDDIITNHQPITHILSALVQQIRDPNTTFSLLVSHRTAVIIWSSIWSLLLVAYFGIGSFLFVVIYELTKSFMFGNLFLAEGIVVYPLLFVVGIVIYRKDLNRFTLTLLGISLALVFLTLGPIWPALGFLGLLLIFQLKNYSKKRLVYLVLGFLMVVIFAGKYTSIPDYMHVYLYINYVYTVPEYHSTYSRVSWAMIIFKAFATPLLSFIKTKASYVLWVIRISVLLLTVNVIYLIYRGRLIRVLTLLILLGLSNIRFTDPGNSYTGGFHLLPWYSVLIFITMAISTEQLRQKSSIFLKIIIVIIIIASFFVSFKFAQNVFLRKDPQKEYTINYSTHTDIGQIVNIMKSPEDTLFVSPDAWLVYWQSNTHHVSKLFGYHPWMNGIPEFHKKIIESFNKNPPTFFYCDNCKGLDLEAFLYQYQEIKRNGGPTRLFVLPFRIGSQTKFQLDQLSFYNVSL